MTRAFSYRSAAADMDIGFASAAPAPSLADLASAAFAVSPAGFASATEVGLRDGARSVSGDFGADFGGATGCSPGVPTTAPSPTVVATANTVTASFQRTKRRPPSTAMARADAWAETSPVSGRPDGMAAPALAAASSSSRRPAHLL